MAQWSKQRWSDAGPVTGVEPDVAESRTAKIEPEFPWLAVYAKPAGGAHSFYFSRRTRGDALDCAEQFAAKHKLVLCRLEPLL